MKIKIRLLLAIGLMCSVSARVVRAASYSGNTPPGGPGSIGTDVITNNTGNTWGSFANTFGNNGQYVGEAGICACMEIYPSGNIVLVGANVGQTQIKVELVTPQGKKISSVLLSQPVSEAYPISGSTLVEISALAVALGNSAKLYIGGELQANFGGDAYFYGFVCCLKGDGTLDATFGVGGYRIFAFEGAGNNTNFEYNTINAIKVLSVQGVEKIMVAGGCSIAGVARSEFYAVALLSNAGAVLSKMKLAAHVMVSVGTEDAAYSIGVQNVIISGQLVKRYIVGGFSNDGGGNEYISCVGMLLSGDTFSLDASFGTGTNVVGSSLLGSTVVIPTVLGGVEDKSNLGMVVNPLNNTITLAGFAQNSAGNKRFAVVQLTKNGSLNTNFVGNNNRPGTAVVATSITGAAFGEDQINTIIADDNGNLIVGGYSEDIAAKKFFALAVFNPTGQLNTAFGNAGKKSLPAIVAGGNLDYIGSLVVDSNNNILAAGTSNNNFALVKLVGNIVSSPSINGSSPTSNPITAALTPAAAAVAIQTAQNAGAATVGSVSEASGQLSNADYLKFVTEFNTNLSNSGAVKIKNILNAANSAIINFIKNTSNYHYVENSADRELFFFRYRSKEELSTMSIQKIKIDFALLFALSGGALGTERSLTTKLSDDPTLYACALYVAGFIESLSAQNITGL